MDHHDNGNDIVVVFDWDDTLVPTSTITAYGSTALKLPQQQLLLQQSDEPVLQALTAACDVAQRVCILTNGSRNWVEGGLAHMPKSRHFIEGHGILIVSARDLYQYDYNDPMRWKLEAYKSAAVPRAKHIISIGDSRLDGTAAIEHCTQSKCHADFWQLQRRPSPEHVLAQLEDIAKTMRERVAGVLREEH